MCALWPMIKFEIIYRRNVTNIRVSFIIYNVIILFAVLTHARTVQTHYAHTRTQIRHKFTTVHAIIHYLLHSYIIEFIVVVRCRRCCCCRRHRRCRCCQCFFLYFFSSFMFIYHAFDFYLFIISIFFLLYLCFLIFVCVRWCIVSIGERAHDRIDVDVFCYFSCCY